MLEHHLFIVFASVCAVYFVAFRKFDFFTMAFFGTLTYFLPGLFGYVRHPHDFHFSLVPIQAQVYWIYMAVLAQILLGSIIYQSLFGRAKPIVWLRNQPQHQLFVPLLLGAATVTLIMMSITIGDVLFSSDKSELLKKENIWFKVHSACIVLFAFAALYQPKWIYKVPAVAFVLFSIYLGHRSYAAMTVVGVLGVFMYGKIPIVVLLKYRRAGLSGLGVLALLFIYKNFYVAVKQGDVDLLLDLFWNSDTYYLAFMESEPFMTQDILNQVVLLNLESDLSSLKSVPAQLVPLIHKVIDMTTLSFSYQMKTKLYYGLEFGIGSNVYAQLYSMGGMLGITLFFVIYAPILGLMNRLITWRGDILKCSLLACAGYLTFYYNRNDVGYTVTLIRRLLLISVACYVPARFLSSLRTPTQPQA